MVRAVQERAVVLGAQRHAVGACKAGTPNPHCYHAVARHEMRCQLTDLRVSSSCILYPCLCP